MRTPAQDACRKAGPALTPAANGDFRNPARLLAEGFREREPDGDCGLSPRDIAAARA